MDIEELTEQTPKISELMYFDFYDRVWCLDKKHPSTTNVSTVLRSWLVISQNYK